MKNDIRKQLINRMIQINGLMYRITDSWFSVYGHTFILEVYGEGNSAYQVHLSIPDYENVAKHYGKYPPNSQTAWVYELSTTEMPV